MVDDSEERKRLHHFDSLGAVDLGASEADNLRDREFVFVEKVGQ